MDFLRTAYSTTGYSFDPVSGMMVPFDMNWYRAGPLADPIGVHHQYASSRNTFPTAYPEQVGEVLSASKVYSKGIQPAGTEGVNHCGDSWTGQLERLTVPIPNNAFDQPACCFAPVQCQQFGGAAAKSAREGDVGPFQALHLVGGGKWVAYTGPGGPRLGFVQAGAGLCHGQLPGQAVIVGAAPAYAVISTALCDYCPVPWRLGRWYFPLSDPNFPGTIVWVKSS
jgi:hypothetical protein